MVCVSSCKGLAESNCVNRCSYVNNKYCRLKSTFKMVKPGCNVVKKMTKQNAKTTIQRFMKKTTFKRKAHYLKTLCADSGACFAFGKEIKRLMSFFEFRTFKYSTLPFRSIGEVSANGFVKEISYEREGYKAYAALKSSLRASADNLAYEYLVGEYINEQSKHLPCFIDTYGLFLYDSVRDQERIKQNQAATLVPINPYHLNTVCQYSDLICILTQHIPNARSMESLAKSPSFLIHDAIYAYYQVYFTLHQLRHTFTHYDLHGGNVLLYEPVVGGYIQYHYHLPSGDVSFKTKYMVKIIDYGRSYFPGANNYYLGICQNPACNPRPGVYYECGASQGLGWMSRKPADHSSSYINSLYKNESHDLRLIKYCHDEFYNSFSPHSLQKTYFLQNHPEVAPLFDLFEQVTYLDFYGTPENLHHEPNKINNVTDAELRFRELVQQNVLVNDAYYAGSNKIGELHVYTDGRPIRFEST
jgi:hypothetical protein